MQTTLGIILVSFPAARVQRTSNVVMAIVLFENHGRIVGLPGADRGAKARARAVEAGYDVRVQVRVTFVFAVSYHVCGPDDRVCRS